MQPDVWETSQVLLKTDAVRVDIVLQVRIKFIFLYFIY
jgi:hypothetical protein